MEKQFTISLPEQTARELLDYCVQHPGTYPEGFIEAWTADTLDRLRLAKEESES